MSSKKKSDKKKIAKEFKGQAKTFEALASANTFSGNIMMAEITKGLAEVCHSLAKFAEEDSK